jgi:hypothetical protein
MVGEESPGQLDLDMQILETAIQILSLAQFFQCWLAVPGIPLQKISDTL